MAGEHDGRVEPGKARQAVQVVDQASSSMAVARYAGTQTRDRDDTGQQVVSAEQGSFFGVPRDRWPAEWPGVTMLCSCRPPAASVAPSSTPMTWSGAAQAITVSSAAVPRRSASRDPRHAKSDHQVDEGLGVGGTDQASHLRQTAHDATTRTTNDRRGGTEVVRMSMGDNDLFDIAQPTTVGAQQTLELRQ